MSTQNTRKVVLDSSAWIEYASGTERGRKVAEAMKDAQVCMCSYNVLESCSHALKHGADDEMVLRAILDRSLQIYVDGKLAIAAARMHFAARKKKPKFSYGDALAFVAADEFEATLITCDNDFQGMKNAVVIR